MVNFLTYIFYFLLWTFLLYWIHRLAHMYRIPFLTKMHWDHHKQVTTNNLKGFHWTNFFLFTDTWKSTFDLWLTEILPTLIYCIVTDQWWIAVFYYIWAAFFQEAMEHSPKLDIYPYFTSGRWHLIHHKDSRVNFGLFFPIWDIIFRTASDKKLDVS